MNNTTTPESLTLDEKGIPPNSVILDANGVLLDLYYYIRWFFCNVPNFDKNELFKSLKDKQSAINYFMGQEESALSKIPAMKGAREGIDKLSKLDLELIVVSNSGEKSAEAKKAALIRLFGPVFYHIEILEPLVTKKDFYEKFKLFPNTLVLDDSYKNCFAALSTGLFPIWMKGFSSILMRLFESKESDDRNKIRLVNGNESFSKEGRDYITSCRNFTEAVGIIMAMRNLSQK